MITRQHDTVTRRIRLTLTASAALMLGLLLDPTAATAQSGRQMMVIERDDGAGSQVAQFTMPDMRALRRPDYQRSDLPVFFDRLVLDDAQRMVVTTLMDAYLNSFGTLMDESLPESGPMFFSLGGGGGAVWGHDGGEDGEGMGEGIDAIINEALGGLEGVTDVDTDLNGSGVEVSVGVTAFAGGGGGGGGMSGDDGGEDGEGDQMFVVVAAGEDDGSAPDMQPGVFVGIQTPDGVDLPDDVRKMLEEKAAAMAVKLQEQMDSGEMDDHFHDEDAMFHSIDDRMAEFEEINEQADEFAKEKKELKGEFEREVKMQLSLEQMDMWPGLERTLTRKKTLPEGRLDGEKTDLVELVDKLRLDEEEQEPLNEKINAYEVALHDALVRRNEFLEDADTKIDESIKSGKIDRALLTVDRATKLRVAVRDINRSYSDAIAQSLEEEDAARFRERVQRSFHPRVYRRTRAERAFESVERLDLDPETEAGMNELAKAYATELEQVNAAIVRSILSHQPKESRDSIERVGAIMEGAGGGPMTLDDGDDPIEKAFARRTALDERYMKLAYGMLSDEQRKGLPRLPSEDADQPFVIIGGDGQQATFELAE